MNRANLNTRLREETIKQVSVQHQFEAVVKLYEAACMMNHTGLMEQYRGQLHDLIDLKLDTCNAIAALTRQLIHRAGDE